MLVSVEVSSEGSLSTGTPAPLFQTRARSPISSSDIFSYDVTPDGKRFLVDRYVKPTSVPSLSIILQATNVQNSRIGFRLEPLRAAFPQSASCIQRWL